MVCSMMSFFNLRFSASDSLAIALSGCVLRRYISLLVHLYEESP